MILILCIYLPNFTCVVINLLISVYVMIFINKVVYGTRAHQNTWGRVSQVWKQVWKRDNEILNFRNKQLFGMDASGCADKPWQFFCTCAVVFPLKMVEQMIMTSLNDVTRISHAIEGGNYKRGSTTELKEFDCCYYCHLGVSAQALGSLLSHRPSTLAVSVPLE